MHVAYMLQNHHYSKQDFDDKVSGTMLHNYLNMLDFKHIFFTQKDVDEFKDKYDTTLDDHVLMRNISPAIEIYDIYKQRVKDRVEFLKRALDSNKFTFDSKRTIQIKRDKTPWPKDKAEQDKLGWKPALPRPRKVSAALKAYAKLATSADKGAVRDLSLLD